MSISVHIPAKLLQQAESRAKALGISRNRLIILALERELQMNSEWSVGFFDRLRSVDEETTANVDRMMSAIRQGRQSKP